MSNEPDNKVDKLIEKVDELIDSRLPNKEKVHKSVRNILFNELGVNEELVKKIIEEKVEKSINQLMLNNYCGFETYIRDFVKITLDRQSKYHSDFKDHLSRLTKEAVRDWVSEHFTIGLNIEPRAK
jgi:uncharacterized membrane protein YheB (UPF0754 family)